MSSVSEIGDPALILGVNGQDGSYLAERLLELGHRVVGVGRQAESRWVDHPRFTYVGLDLADAAALTTLLDRIRPARIYHVAAVHGSAGHRYEASWGDALAVNVGCVHTCLEYLRLRAPAARLFYASSLKAFGDPPPALIDEATPRRSTCLYGITKNAATELVQFYRAQHGVVAAVGYFFNHDSPRRPDSYFIPRLVRHLVGERTGQDRAPNVASLDFWCDWGSAREYMELTVDLLEAPAPADAVFATGRPVHATDLAAALAGDLGLPLPAATRSEASPPVLARLDGLRAAAGRLPRLGGIEVARWILQERYGHRLQELRA